MLPNRFQGSPINQKEPVKMAFFLVSRLEMRYDIGKEKFNLYVFTPGRTAASNQII